MPYSPFRFPLRRSSSSGLSRIELLVSICVVLILAVVGYSYLSSYLNRISPSRAAEAARTINTLLSQYATDNNGVYPVGENTPAVGKSEGIARSLIENNYTPDASVFAVGSTPRYEEKDASFTEIGAANLSWDFTAGATASTGITSQAPDLLPTVYTTGETVNYTPPPGSGLNVELSGNGPFAKKGMAVAYKGGNAVFIPGTPSGANVESQGFLSNAFKDAGPYTQIKP
jgi:type II secretory pathway pseudopilin PulG